MSPSLPRCKKGVGHRRHGREVAAFKLSSNKNPPTFRLADEEIKSLFVLPHLSGQIVAPGDVVVLWGFGAENFIGDVVDGDGLGLDSHWFVSSVSTLEGLYSCEDSVSRGFQDFFC